MKRAQENIIPVIVLNWNGLDDTIECIESLLVMSSPDFHIYLIDNHSSGSEIAEIRELYTGNPRISLRFNDRNLGFTGAHIKIWEEELQYLRCPYIALVNNDTAVDPNWLDELLEAAETFEADVVSSKMIYYYDRTIMDNAGHRMLNTGEIIPIGHAEPVDEYDKPFDNLGACAGACLYSTAMIRMIGFFDDAFTTGYEDAEFGLRATLTKHRCIYAPEAIVYHKIGRSINKVFNEEYSMMIHKSILYTYFKLMPLLNILCALPSFIFKYGAMFLIDVLFWRPKYLKVLSVSWHSIIFNTLGWKNKRQAFYQGRYERLKYLKHQYLIFFLGFDIKRFVDYFILKKVSSIDTYTSHESDRTHRQDGQ